MNGWIAVDVDGTVAEYDTWQGPEHLGAPIAKMVERIKAWIAAGREVRLFTARAYPICLGFPNGIGPNDILPSQHTQRGQECVAAVQAIRRWSAEHIGRSLTITCIKDFSMDTLYDDRAVQVRKNTGEVVGDEN